jgi:hypothetical protein
MFHWTAIPITKRVLEVYVSLSIANMLLPPNSRHRIQTPPANVPAVLVLIRATPPQLCIRTIPHHDSNNMYPTIEALLTSSIDLFHLRAATCDSSGKSILSGGAIGSVTGMIKPSMLSFLSLFLAGDAIVVLAQHEVW